MNYAQLKTEIESAPVTSRATLERLFLRTTIGNAVKPDFAPFLERAANYRGFFDALYADEGLKFTDLWGDWARFSHKSWLFRFEPQIALQNIRLSADGLPVQFGTGLFLAPTGSRDSIANFYVFEQGTFNTAAAQFVTSIGGTFSCAGYDFAGIYGVYQYRGNVIFEQWEAERPPAKHEG